MFAGHERVLWEGPMWGGTFQRIIGYGAMRQPRPNGDPVDWFVVGLAAQKAHLSLYVSAVEGGQYLVKRYADRLGKVKAGSANVTFRRLADLHLPVVVEMATRARDLVFDNVEVIDADKVHLVAAMELSLSTAARRITDAIVAATAVFGPAPIVV